MGQVIMRYGRTRQSEEGASSGAVGTTNITNVSASAYAASGSTPSVSASLSDTSLSFTFGLVPGATGPQGEEGPQGETGNGISGISLISTSGKVKTYRISFTDGTYYDFSVTDGADGAGAGDMTKAVYDKDDDGYVDAVEDMLDPGTGIEFSLDANGKGQYRSVGATTWIPFLSGGGMTATRLWTNNSPSASFGAQTINLSEAASNFDAVRIVWEYNTSSGVTADNWEGNSGALSTLYELGSATLVGNSTVLQMGAVFTASNWYARKAYFASNAYTSITFSAPTRGGASGTSNTNLIPILVEGITFG